MLGTETAGRHFCLIREPATAAAQQWASGWHGLANFLCAVGALDMESQRPLQQKQNSWMCSAGALLHMMCPPAGRALFSEAASVHVRRLLDPNKPTCVQAAVGHIAAAVVLLLFLAAGCALLQLVMLAGTAAICSLLVCLSAHLYAQPQQYHAVPQPAWALLLIWGAAGAVSWQEAKRRRIIAQPWTLRLGRQLVVIIAVWAAATMALACVLLLRRLCVDLMVTFAPALTDRRSKTFDGSLPAGGSANY